MQIIRFVPALMTFTSAMVLVQAALAQVQVDASGATAGSQSQNAGVMVRPFTGPRSHEVMEAAIRSFEKAGVTLVPAGFEGGVELKNDPAPYVEVAQENDIRAYVHGEVKMSDSGWVLQLGVRNAGDGAIVGSEELEAKNLPGLLQAVQARLPATLDGLIGQTQVPGADAQPAKAGAEFSASSSGATAPSAARGAREEEPLRKPIPLHIELGGFMFLRDLSYSKPVGDKYEHGLQPHSFPGVGVRAAAQWYPVAHFQSGVFANLGVTASYYHTVGGETVIGPLSFATQFTELNVGLRARVPLGAADIGLNVGMGQQQLVITGDNELVNDGGMEPRPDPGVLPDAKYTYFRTGPDFRFPFIGLDWTLGAYLRMISLGDEPGYLAHDDWFPRATALGAEVQLAARFEFSEMFALQLMAEARRVGMDMHSSFEDVEVTETSADLLRAIAGGALDQYVGGSLSLVFTLPAPKSYPKSAPESEEDEEEFEEEAIIEEKDDSVWGAISDEPVDEGNPDPVGVVDPDVEDSLRSGENPDEDEDEID